MMLAHQLDILAISAHPDDAEVAIGGTLLRHAALGKTVGLLDLTRGELGTRGNADLRSQEAHEAARRLGATVRVQMDLPDGFLDFEQGSILKVVVQLRALRPRTILTTATKDRHPDHARAAEITVQAAFLAGLPKIVTHDADGQPQQPWKPSAVYHYHQDCVCTPDFVVDISEVIDQKFDVVRAYKSQFYDPLSTEPETPISCQSFFEAIRGKNAAWGRTVGVAYGEAFSATRVVGIRDITQIF